MAKAGGGFLAALGGFILAAIAANRRQRKQAEDNYRKAMDQELREHAAEQAEFEAMMAKIPALMGDEKFIQSVDLSAADHFALDAFTQYQELTQDKDVVVWATISFFGDLDDEPGERIEVMISEAEMGFIPSHDEQRYFQVLEDAGGLLKCSAKLRRNGDDYRLNLDIALPAKILKQ